MAEAAPRRRVGRRPRTSAWLRRWGWAVFLAVGVVIEIVRQLTTTVWLGDILFLTCGAAGTAAILAGMRLHRPQRQRAWLGIAGSQLLWTIADAISTVQAAVAPSDAFPTVADAFYLLGYPLLFVGLTLLCIGRRPHRDIEGVLDCTIAVAPLYLLSWILLAQPILTTFSDAPVAAVVALAYPVLDIVVISVLVAVIITPGTRTPALRLLGGAILLVIVADTAAAALGRLSFATSGPIDFVWLLSYLLIGAAALHPSMRTLSATAPEAPPVLSRQRVIATVLAVLVAPTTLAVEYLLGVPLNVWAVVIASVGISLLVVARMNLAIHQIVGAERQRAEAQHALAHQAAHDALTGLPNRAQSLELLTGTLARAQRSGAMIGLLFVDLDGFKAVNDSFGHAAGDEVLQVVSRRMQRAVRKGDVVGRLGGDEFVVLLEPVVDEEAAVGVGQRLIADVSQPVVLTGGQEVHVGASVGVAISQDSGMDADALLVEADTAAYRAKHRGRGRTEVFDAGLRKELQTRLELERDLRQALRDDQLDLRFAPIVDLSAERPVGWEAVLHWHRPGVGLVAVPDFRPVAETTDLIFELDAWALQHAAGCVAGWEAAGVHGLKVGVRVSIRHLKRNRILDDVAAALLRSRIAPDQLAVQVSDTGLIDDPVVLDHLARLQSKGVLISLDDFGIGYSSVRRLAQLPVSAVKLHRSLLDGNSPTTLALLELMVRGVQNFGMLPVIKGVRTPEDIELVGQVGCGFAQGELFGELLSAEEVLRGVELRSVHS